MRRGMHLLRQSGTTLLELLIALLILAILLGLAMPGLHETLQHKSSDSNAKLLVTAIAVARTAAISKSSLVTLCKSADGRECKGNWEDGILVFVDYNGDRRLDAEDFVVRHFQFSSGLASLHWRAFQNRQYLQFTAMGFTRYQNGNFTLCPKSGDLRFARQLILTRTARVRHAQDSDGDGIREDSRGRDLRC